MGARDALLVQGPKHGPAASAKLEGGTLVHAELEKSMKHRKFRDHHVKDRVLSNIRKSQKWAAIETAQAEGDIPKLRKALKSARVDVTLCSMPSVRNAEAALGDLAWSKSRCQEFLDGTLTYDGKKPLTSLKQMHRAAQYVHTLPLGPKVWEDPVLSDAKSRLDAEGMGL